MKKVVLVIALGAAVLACGVPKSQYDALTAQEQKEKTESDQQISDLKKRIAELEGKQTDEQTRAELEELRAAKAAAEARGKLFDDFVKKFNSMIDAEIRDIATLHRQIVLSF